METQALKKMFFLMSLILACVFVMPSITVASTSNVSVRLDISLKNAHSHHDRNCEVSNPHKDCVFKSISLPANAFQNASQNEIFVFNQHNPNTQASGFSWISWGGESGLLPMLSALTKTAPSSNYKNPYDKLDRTPNVNDWMYSAYLTDLENIDLLIKFKLLNSRKEMWVPLWKAQSNIEMPQPSGLFGWIKKATCWIGLLECDQRAVYQIAGYAVVDVLDAGFSFQNGKKVPWVKVAFKGFKHCFNRPPTTTSQQQVTPEDQALPIQLKASDLDGQSLSFTVTKQPSHGVLSSDSNGKLLYTPNPNYFGIDEFSYQVSDGIDHTAGQVSIEVTPVNDAPIPLAQNMTTLEDTSFDLVLSAEDVDSNVLTYQISQQPTHGQLNVEGQKVRYTPHENYSGVDQFDFTVTDGLSTRTTTITITVSPVNDMPVAKPQQLVTLEDAALNVVLLGLDPDGDSLTYQIVQAPKQGRLVGQGAEQRYIPNPNYSGLDQFEFLVSDGELIHKAIIEITVKPVNDAPIAKPQQLKTLEDTAKEITLFGDDIDGDELSYSIKTQPKHGEIRLIGSQVIYTPTENYAGEDQFVYLVSDGELSHEAVIDLQVEAVNDAPSAKSQQIETPEDVVISIEPQTLDVDSNNLTYQILVQPKHGMVTVENSKLVYTPAENYNGVDTFSYQVSDGDLTATAEIEIMITPVNDAPVAVMSQHIIANGSLTAASQSTDIDGLEDIVKTEWFINGQLIHEGLTLNQLIVLPFYAADLKLRVTDRAGLSNEISVRTQTQCKAEQTRVKDICVDSGQLKLSADQVETNQTVEATAETNYPNAVYIEWIVDGISQGVQEIQNALTQTILFTVEGVKSVIAVIFDDLGQQLERLQAELKVNNPLLGLDAKSFEKVTFKNSSVTIDFLKENQLDVSYSVRILKNPEFGSVKVNGGLVTYEPSLNYLGKDELTYQLVKDGKVTSSATVDIDVIESDNRGREFWLTFLQNYQGKPDKLNVFISSDIDTVATVEIPRLGYKKTVNVAANTVTTVDLTDFYLKISSSAKQIADFGIYVYSDDLISVYSINQLKYTTDAASIIPIQALGQGYMTAGYDFSAGAAYGMNEQLAIVATSDATDVMVSKYNGLANQNRPSLSEQYTVTLQRGQVLYLSETHLGGTLVNANKKIAFFSGNACASIRGLACDHLYEQIAPTDLWSTDLMTAPLATRKNGDTFRIYAAFDNTRIYFNKKYKRTLNRGETFDTLVTESTRIQSNLPIWVNQFSNGSTFDGVVSDPFMMGIAAENSYLKKYIFSTPENGFSVHFVNVISKATDTSSLTLDGTKIGDSTVWTTISDSDYKYAQIPISKGTHIIEGSGKFGLSVYGFGSFDSYGYSGGMDFSQKNSSESDMLSTDEEKNLKLSAIAVDATIKKNPANGSLVIDNGSYIYKPKKDFFGLDEIRYQTYLGSKLVEKVLFIEVFNVDDAPSPIDVEAETKEDVILELKIPRLDIDNEILNFKLLSSQQSAKVDFKKTDDQFIYYNYTPPLNYYGADMVLFETSDGKAQSTVTATIKITPVNDAPTVTPFTVKTGIDPVSFDLSKDDNGIARGSDVEDSPLTYHTTSNVSGGKITRVGNMVTFTPDAGFDGLGHIYYYAKDQEGLSGTAIKITVNVERVNDTPVATSQSFLINEDTSKAVTLSATDEESTTLDYVIVTPPRFGQLIGSGVNYVYVPNPNFNGIDSFVYEASDGNTSSRGQVTFSVGSINDAPTTQDQEIVTDEDTPISITLKGTDVDGDPLSYEITNIGSSGILTGSLPQFIYTPKPDVFGQDVIRFRVFDGQAYAYGQIKVAIRPINDAPKAQPLTLTVSEDSTINYSLLAADAEGSALTYRIVRQPKFGVVTHSGSSRSGSYKPNLNFFGPDTFEYEVSDGVLSSIETVTVNVQPIDDAPTAQNSVQDVRKNYESLINLLGADADGDSLTYTIIQQPLNGTITPNGAQPIYKPNSNYEGTDSIKFEVSDGRRKATATVTLTVKAMSNRLPIWRSTAPSTAEVNSAYLYTLSAYDPDNEAVSYRMTADAPAGMTISANQLSWTPISGQEGAKTFSIEAVDSEGGVTPQIVTVKVNEIRLPPSIQSQPITTGYAGKTYRYRVLATDPNKNDTLRYSIENAPKGMQINAEMGEIVWFATSEGSYSNIKVKVADGYWVVTQTFNLTVKKAAPLSVTILAPNQVNQNEPFEVSVNVVGASSDAQVELLQDGVPVQLDAAFKAAMLESELGEHQLQASVQDGNESVSTTAIYIVRYLDDTTAPVVKFTQTEGLQFITKPTSIIGEITDNTAVSWQVSLYESYDPEASNNPLPIKQFNGRGARAGSLIDIDPTLLENGAYVVVVKVTDAGGNSTTALQNIIVDGKMKIGELAFTLEDAVIPMPSLDVSLQRSYDSRQGMKVGDFGYGWRLGVQQIKMRQSRPIHSGWEAKMVQQQFAYGGSSFGRVCIQPIAGRPAPIVTVTLPDGDVETFAVKFDCRMATMANGIPTPGIQFTYHLEPTGDTQSTLTITEPQAIELRDGRWVMDSGQNIDSDGNVSYSWLVPENFSLTTVEGIRYDFNKTKGLQKITEPTGNTLTITPTAITHSLGKKITYVRDSLNRISSVTLPNNQMWTYTYDSKGDLNKVRAPDGTENKYEYDANHRLLKITDAFGVQLTGYEYDADGRLVAMLDASGSRIEMQHDLAANTERVTNANGFTTTYVYDDYGNITQETDAFGQTTVRSYNSTYDKLSETDALGRTTTWRYDNKHNKLSETNALGQTTNYSYDERGNLLSETDHLGRIVNQVAYDTSGQPTTIQDVLGQSTSMSYASGGLASLTDALGNTINYTYTAGNMTRMVEASGQIHDYTYDTNNRKTRELVSYKTANGSLTNYANSWTYDAKGRVVSETINGITTSKSYGLADELLSETVAGHVTSYVYDANKKRIQTTYPDGSISRSSYDAAGNLLSTTDPLGRVTRYSYDALNRQIAMTHPDGSITRSEYDTVGNVVAEIDAQGLRTVHEYDALNRRIKTTNALGFSTTTLYDNLGRVASETDALGRVTQYQYDALNHRTGIIFPNGTQSQTEYDALGRKVAEINPLGQRTEYRYNAASQLTHVIDALGQSTQYAYDQAGNKVSQTDALGRVNKWSYDGYGRMNGHTLPNNRARSQGYDSKGRLVSSNDFNGQNTAYRYDANDRLIAKQYNGAQDVQHYDAAGQLIRSEQVDAQGSSQTSNYRYDLMGRLIEEIKPTGDRLSYSYDRNGNKTQMSYSAVNGQNATPISSTQYSYDALNRLIAVTDAQGSTTYTYDAVGNRVTELQPNGIRTEYAYNANNQVIYMAHYRQNTLLDEYRYTVDAAGQRVALEEVQYENGQASSKNSTWQFDALGRLTSETTSTPSTATQTTQYQHDAVGNVVQKTISTDNSNDIITTYSYDVNDRLLSENKAGQITNYSYDNQGNTLTETRAGQTKSYVYNSQNQLIKTTLNGQQLQFSYDVDGIRNSKTVNGQVTAYVVDKTQAYAQVIAEFGSNGMTQYTYGDTGLLRQTVNRNSNGTTTSQSHYLLKDALGSTKALADATGTLTDSYAYDAYGEIIASAGTTPNHYKYAGEQYDQDLGMYYNRARYYNQSIGRFSQMDSWQGQANSPITLNKYVYANANPVMYTDPSGNMAWLADFGASLRIQSTLSSIRYGAVTSVGNIVIGGVLRPIVTTASSHVSGVAIAGVFYATATNYCRKNDDCELPMPVIFYGLQHGELTQHIFEAQVGKGANALLHRMPTGGWGRSWLSSTAECNKDIRTKDGRGLDCDEYPFNSSVEGGPANYSAGRVSLKFINPVQNRDGGRLLGGMYKADGLVSGEQFLTLVNPASPLSFYMTRKGKFRMTRGAQED